MSPYHFHVDYVSDTRIDGWAKRLDSRSHRPNVELFINGQSITHSPCKIFRHDLISAGIGDGYYGFSLFLKSPINITDDLISIVVDKKHKYTLYFSDGDVAIKEVFDDIDDIYDPNGSRVERDFISDGRPIIYCDITDLFFYWSHHRRVSGIQRVQLGYVKYILKSQLKNCNIIFCFKHVPGALFYVIENSELEKLIDMNYSDVDVTDNWSILLHQILRKNREPTMFLEDQTLLVLGAPWVSPDYYEIIASIKSRYNIRIIQLIYDIIPLMRPDFCDRQLVKSFSEFFVQCVSIADAFLAISRHTKTELQSVIQEWNMPEKSIKVVPMGTELTLPVSEQFSRQIGPDIKKLLAKKYVLFVSTVEARKNHRFIVDIWRSMIAHLGADKTPTLVWVGRRGWLVEDLFNQMEATNWLDEHVLHLQDLSDYELEQLYQECMFTVFPSLYEGWGLPVTESFRYGKVCISSKNSSISEAGQDLAVYIDTNNSSSALKTIMKCIQDPQFLNDKEKSIKKNFSHVSWDDATEYLLDSVLEIIRDAREIESEHVSFPEEDVRIMPSNLPMFHIGERIEFSRFDKIAKRNVLNIPHVMKRYAFYGGKWHDPEDWGRWSGDRVARLIFGVELEEKQNIAVYLGLRFPGYYNGNGVRIATHNKVLGKIDLYANGQDNVTRVEVPFDCFILVGKSYYVALEFLMGEEPRKPPEGNDDRMIGLGISHLKICRADDLVSRIEYLEDRMGLKHLESVYGFSSQAPDL